MSETNIALLQSTGRLADPIDPHSNKYNQPPARTNVIEDAEETLLASFNLWIRHGGGSVIVDLT